MRSRQTGAWARRPGKAFHLAWLALSAIAPGCGDGSASMPMPMPTPIQCQVATPAAAPPYPAEFRFSNDTAAPLFINKNQGCAGVDFSVSSCASGFRDRLGPTYHCACACDEPSCTSQPACGPCLQPEGVLVPPGGSVAVPWNGVLTSDHEKPRAGGGTFWCVRSRPLAAGRYRVAIRVFDDQVAAAGAVGGRTVTRDFELPAAGDVVDVPLGATALDDCDPTPDAMTPVCTGSEARDVPCSLGEPLAFAWEGGLAPSYDRSEVTLPATYARRRVFTMSEMPELSCSAAIPRCARDSRVVTTADVTRVVNDPAVLAAYADGTPVYGYDDRNNDGRVLILRRPDGTSLAIGSECTGCSPNSISRPLTPALGAVIPVLSTLEQQMIATPACSAFGPAFRY